jgi:hypothetical protein
MNKNIIGDNTTMHIKSRKNQRGNDAGAIQRNFIPFHNVSKLLMISLFTNDLTPGIKKSTTYHNTKMIFQIR